MRRHLTAIPLLVLMAALLGACAMNRGAVRMAIPVEMARLYLADAERRQRAAWHDALGECSQAPGVTMETLRISREIMLIIEMSDGGDDAAALERRADDLFAREGLAEVRTALVFMTCAREWPAFLEARKAVAAARAGVAAVQAEARSGPMVAPGLHVQPGVPVYGADECIGAVVNGRCHGSILPNAGYRPTCHGQMVGGMCTGPMF